jgi:hypothetical protein
MSRLLFALAGPIVWLLLFSALYAIETMACTPAVGLGGTGYGTMAGAAVIATGLLLAAVTARRSSPGGTIAMPLRRSDCC